MDLLEYKPNVGGGRAGGGGGFYHLSFRSGSRAGGASARAAFDYVSRRDEYADRDLDEALYTESEHMPSWAEHDPEQFWDAADLYERVNGRLYVSADFALPRDLPSEAQVELARAFAHELTDNERLPYVPRWEHGARWLRRGDPADAQCVRVNPATGMKSSTRRS